MTARTTLIASVLLATGLVSGAAQAALLGRDLDGNFSTFEAYYDTVLDITWLGDANAALGSSYDTADGVADGRMRWQNAMNWAANLSFTDGVHVFDNWRLPTVEPINGVSFTYSSSTDGSTDVGYNITSPQSELAYMFYVNLGNSGYYTPAGAVSGCYVSGIDTCLDSVGPFSNLQLNPYRYWFSTEYAPRLGGYSAWAFTTDEGYQGGFDKAGLFRAWAVSPGDVAAIPEAETYALMLAGLGLIGWRARQRG
jgi:hypothetical protein